MTAIKKDIVLMMRQGYWLALFLIMLVAILKFVTLESLVIQQESASTVINVSGRQRMLSQRIAFFAELYAQERKESARVDFISAVDDFEDSHNDLIKGNPARGLVPLNNAEIFDIYFKGNNGLDSLVNEYVRSARIIASEEDEEKVQAAMAYIVDFGPNILLEKLNDVVFAHELKSDQDIANILMFQKIFLVATIVILICEALFLFAPMARRIARNIEEIKNRGKIIEDQYKELEMFAVVSSHNLQEPLRKVISFSQRLETALAENKDERVQAYLSFVLSGADHMRGLVRGLYAYARVSTEDADLTECDIEDIVTKVAESLLVRLKSNDIKIIHQDLPSIIYGATHISEIFKHLIENAIKYRDTEKPNSVIKISAVDRGYDWAFCVEDNGVGIDERFHDRIFSLFQRLHRKEEIEGTGFGLTIVRRIVERYHGKIWLESEEGKGSRFFFSVPKDIQKESVV